VTRAIPRPKIKQRTNRIEKEPTSATKTETLKTQKSPRRNLGLRPTRGASRPVNGLRGTEKKTFPNISNRTRATTSPFAIAQRGTILLEEVGDERAGHRAEDGRGEPVDETEKEQSDRRFHQRVQERGPAEEKRPEYKHPFPPEDI